jgi:ferredoxin
MKILIYYFSGTGNSLLLAKKIAGHLDGAVLSPVIELYGAETDKVSDSFPLLEAPIIGFVFPVYFDRIPRIIHEVIEKNQFENTQYIFAVATSGGQAGNALFELDSLLRSRGKRLDYGKNVDMPDNSIILRTSETESAIRLARTDKEAEEIAAAVSSVTKMDGAFKKNHRLSILGKVNKFAVFHYYKAERRMVDPARCSHCGLCVNICPVKNIAMMGQEVVIGDDCQWCFACINWCPKCAIVFGRIDPSKRQQYRCPDISAINIMRKSASKS